MEKRLTRSALALSLAMFLLGGVAGFFVGYPVGRDAGFDFSPAADADTAGGMTLGDGQNDGIGMTAATIEAENYDEYGIMPIAESAQQVTATVTPAGAEDAVIDWSVAWKSGASGQWGNGKTVTDYVTVTPTEDGALTANVSCLQAFGEQIILTAAIRGNASVKGTATVDYVQKWEKTLTTGDDLKIHFKYQQDEKYNFDWTISGVQSMFGSKTLSFPIWDHTPSIENNKKLMEIFGSTDASIGSVAGYSLEVPDLSEGLSAVYTKPITFTNYRLRVEFATTSMMSNYNEIITANGGSSYFNNIRTYVDFLEGTDLSNMKGKLCEILPLAVRAYGIDWEGFKAAFKELCRKDNAETISFRFTLQGQADNSYKILLRYLARFDPDTIPLSAQNVAVAPGAVEF